MTTEELELDDNIEIILPTTKIEDEEDDTNEPTGDDDDLKSNVEDKTDTVSFTPFYEELFEQEVITVNPDDYEDSPEGFTKMIDDEVGLRLEKLLDTLPPTAKELFNLALEGVDVKEYLQAEEIDYTRIDIEDADNQKNIITEALEAKGFSETKINNYISKLTDEEIKAEAIEALDELVVLQEQKKEDLIAQAKQEKENAVIAQQKELEDIKANVSNIDTIDGFKLDDFEKQKLVDYITVPVAEDKNGNLLTQYELNSLNLSDKLRIAYHSMNEFTNYDNVKRNIKTDVTKTIRENLNKLNTPSYRSGAPINNNKIIIPKIEYNED